MTIHLDTTKLVNNQTQSNPFISAENQYREPSARVDSVSFSTNALPVQRFIATGIVALGTVSITTHAPLPPNFQGYRIVLPQTPSVNGASSSLRYEQLRREIVASGLPLLSDEELRQEIQDRRGIRVEPES